MKLAGTGEAREIVSRRRGGNKEGLDGVDIVQLVNRGGDEFTGVECSGIAARVARRKDESLFT